ncbi:MAG: hypothetical protein RI964_241 [Pseudomonadota bacterium]|jgi:hypothetical protein
MVKVSTQDYAVWQKSLFWFGWIALAIPGFFIAYGFHMLSKLVLNGYHDTIDLVLLLIIGTALLELLLIAIYTLTRFWRQTAIFKRLMLWLMLGIAGIPLAATLGCVFSYAQLVLAH